MLVSFVRAAGRGHFPFPAVSGSCIIARNVSHEESEGPCSFRSLAAGEPTRAWPPLAPEELEARCQWVLNLKPAERRLRVRNSARVKHPDVVCRLIATSYELRLSDPAEAVRVAQAAVDAAEVMELGSKWLRWLGDLRARAWGNLANCFRLVDDVQQAEGAWRHADARLKAGSGDKLLAADLMLKQATLRQAQRRLSEAASLYARATELAAKARDHHLAGKSGLGLAITHFYAGDAKQALTTATQAAQQIDFRREPEMALALLHNTLFFLEADQQHQLALALVGRIEPWYRELESDLLGYRADWLRGRVHSALGHFKTATNYFERARRGFLSAGQVYDAALAGFDLALAWMNVGAHYRVQRLAQEMYAVFTAKEIPREAAATLIVFADAARQQRLNLALMRKLASQLEPLRRSGARPATELESV